MGVGPATVPCGGEQGWKAGQEVGGECGGGVVGRKLGG